MPAGRLLALAGVALGLVAGTGAPGHATTVVVAGWWTAAPVALAPDAPVDGVVIQGGASDALAYGAVRFTLSAGEAPVSFTLRLADGAVSTPHTSLALCPLTEAFEPAQGGPIADAPAFDCTRLVESSPEAGATTYEFDVAGLAADGALAVAILPTAPTDRVALAAPTPADLTTERSGAPTSTPVAGGSGGGAVGSPGDGAVTLPSGSGGGAPSIGIPRPAGGASAAPSPAAAAPAAPAAGAAPGRAATSPVVSLADDGRSWRATLLFLGLAGAAAFLWLRRTTPAADLAPA